MNDQGVEEAKSPSAKGSVSRNNESAQKKKVAPDITEDTFIKMIRLLMDAKEKLMGSGIDINRQDRLGRTVLHLAAHHGMKRLTEVLIQGEKEGGFGAEINLGDLINQRPVHYAI